MRSSTEPADLLHFDRARFATIIEGALSLAQPLRTTMGALLDEGRSNLFFLGTGGAGVLMRPAATMLQRQSAFDTVVDRPAEVVLTGSVALGESSIVVVPSLSATTRESSDVITHAREHGAHVISLTGNGDGPVATLADTNFTTPAADDTSPETFGLQALVIALSVMQHLGERADLDQVLERLADLPSHLVAVKESFEPRAAQLARAFETETYHVVVGAGSTWPLAWYYATCILEEMQWIRTRPVHASDFFHGTLELLEADVPVLLLSGDQRTRPLVERVDRFASTVSDKVTVVDADSNGLPGLPDDVRDLMAPIVLASALQRLSTHLAAVRDHPLTTRRYYKKADYH